MDTKPEEVHRKASKKEAQAKGIRIWDLSLARRAPWGCRYNVETAVCGMRVMQNSANVDEAVPGYFKEQIKRPSSDTIMSEDDAVALPITRTMTYSQAIGELSINLYEVLSEEKMMTVLKTWTAMQESAYWMSRIKHLFWTIWKIALPL